MISMAMTENCSRFFICFLLPKVREANLLDGCRTRSEIVEGELLIVKGKPELAEASSVVYSVTGDQSDTGAVLVGEDPPPIDLLLIPSRRGGRVDGTMWGPSEPAGAEPATTV